MKTIERVLFLLVVTTLLASCGKDRDVTEGYVTEYGSNKPIEGARVLLRELGGSFLGPETTRVLDTTYTDAGGYFLFDRKSAYYDVYASAGGYNPARSTITTINGRTLNKVVLDSHSWTKFNVRKITPPYFQDNIYLGLSGHCERYFNGVIVDTSFVCQRRGNHEYSYRYRTTIDGKVEEKSIRYQTVAHDTVDVLIEW